MNISAMQKEVYEWACSKGWEPDSDRTFGDECALIHSEVSEALEAYRNWKFVDPTLIIAQSFLDEDLSGLPVKPEGVASELADILIRLLHYCEVRSLQIDVSRKNIGYVPGSFGEECAQMHETVSTAYTLYRASDIPATGHALSRLYGLVLRSCTLHGFDLASEYRRKMDYNQTRAYRHGGRTM